MEPVVHKFHIPKSSSVDSLNIQLNTQESILTSTKNQEVILSKLLDRDRRKFIIPTPNRPNTIQVSDQTQINEKEDNHLPFPRQQQINDRLSRISDQLTSQITNDQMNNETCFTNKYSNDSIHVDKQHNGISNSTNPIQQSMDNNVDPQSQSNVHDNEHHFDTFILQHFTPFTGKQNVIYWLNETESKFNKLKISRQSRFDAISLLLEGEAKLRYIIHRKNIQNFDDFYEFLLSRYAVDLTQTNQPQSCHKMINSSLIEHLHPSPTHINKQHQNLYCDLNDIYPRNKSPIIPQNTVVDLGATNVIGAVPDTKSTTFMSDLSTKIIDQTTNDLRKAIVSDLIKNPKTFRGSRDDVQKWLEDIEHIVEIANIPEEGRLALIAYSLRGDALQWYKINKNLFTSWKSFVYEIKRAFTSSFHAEVAFQKLEAYSQGENQSVRNFYNEVLKLCKEADSQMSDSTKLKNLLNKIKPSIQLEVRKKKPNSLAEFLDYAKDAEELFQLSNIHMDSNRNNNYNITNERAFPNPNSSFTSSNSQFDNRFSNKNPSSFSRNFNNNNNNNISNNLSQYRNHRYNNQPQHSSPTYIHNPQSSSNQSGNTSSRFPINRNNNSNHTQNTGRVSTQPNSSYSGYNNQSRTRTANTIFPSIPSRDQESETGQESASTIFCTHCEQYGHELNSCQNF